MPVGDVVLHTTIATTGYFCDAIGQQFNVTSQYQFDR
jgi:hypothetical protein